MKKSYYSCIVPSDMIDCPHLIFFHGTLLHPGKSNDYTLEIKENATILHLWNPDIYGYDEKLISVVKLNNGERWAYSSIEGVYVDTRKI